MIDWDRVRRRHEILFTVVGLVVVILYTFLAVASNGLAFVVDALLVFLLLSLLTRHWVGVWLRYRRRPPAPEPPRNLRAIFPDGRVVPLDLVYTGVRGGVHHWTTVRHYDFTGVDRVALAYLPDNTVIDFYGYAEPGSAIPRVTREGDGP